MKFSCLSPFLSPLLSHFTPIVLTFLLQFDSFLPRAFSLAVSFAWNELPSLSHLVESLCFLQDFAQTPSAQGGLTPLATLFRPFPVLTIDLTSHSWSPILIFLSSTLITSYLLFNCSFTVCMCFLPCVNVSSTKASFFICLFVFSLMHPKHLEQCLVGGQCSINIHWKMEE